MSYDDDGDAEDYDDSKVDSTFLTFNVGTEEYAVSVACVTEIVRMQKSYAIPDVPSYVRGVINLRGKVIPLVDVRSRFGMPQSEYTDRTVIVVLELGDTATGLIVDGVTEVAEIPAEQIEPRPSHGRVARPMVMGVAKRSTGVSFILDVNSMLEVTSEAAASAAMVEN